MNAIFSTAAALKKLLQKESLRQRLLRLGTLPKTLIMMAALGAIALGGQVTIFEDDFNAYTSGDDPGVPLVGEPWQINEVASDGISIVADEDDPENYLLAFGVYRNSAIVPISTSDQELIKTAHNATMSFDYRGYLADGFSHYFDIGGYDAVTGDSAFFLRFAPQESLDGEGLHDVLYRDPDAPELVDTGLNVSSLIEQRISIEADFLGKTYLLDIGGETATFPMFAGLETIGDVRFENYGVAMGSGVIDDLTITVDDGKGPHSVPELAAIWMLVSGGLVCVYVWLFRR